MRKLLVAIALLLGIYFIIIQMAEVQSVVATLKRGDWRYILLGAGLEIGWLVNIGTLYRAVYRSLGLEEKVERLTILAAAVTFANIVAPTAGVSGVAVMVTDARRRGLSGTRVTVAGVLFLLFDYAAFIIVLALGLIVLIRRNNLNSAELIASAILVIIATGLGLTIFLGLRSEQALGNMLASLARPINRLLRPVLHRNYLHEQRAYSFAHEVADGLKKLNPTPENLLLPFALALSSKAFLISILFFMFLAFKVPFSVGTLIAGFSIGYLFMIVSPTPAGLGVVETALTSALRTLTVPLSDAAVLTLAYRGITFWLPLLLGMAAFRWLAHEREAPSSTE